VNEQTRYRALQVLVALVTSVDVVPEIVPGFDGSVNLEWCRAGREFDILIGADSSVTACFYDEGGDEWERPYTEVESKVGSIIGWFATA
jgi:hypothetical protein